MSATDLATPQAASLFPLFRPRRLGHANLYVGDLDRSMDFYKAVVGLEEVYRRPPIKGGFLTNGNTHHDIGMVEISNPICPVDVPGLNHLAFELENEVELVEGYRRAVAADVQFPRTVDHDITRSIYGFDPDGNAVEIYADMTKDWRTRRSGSVTKPTPHWTPGEPRPTSRRYYHENPDIRRDENAVFHPTRITHAVLVVSDYEGALRYYTEGVGLRTVQGGPASAFAALAGACGDCDLALFRAREGRAPGLHHIGFQTWNEADLEQSKARLTEAGISPEIELDHPARRCIYVRDPDGLRIQFYIDRPGSSHRLNETDEEIALYLA